MIQLMYLLNHTAKISDKNNVYLMEELYKHFIMSEMHFQGVVNAARLLTFSVNSMI
jgi:hypothetical protein